MQRVKRQRKQVQGRSIAGWQRLRRISQASDAVCSIQPLFAVVCSLLPSFALFLRASQSPGDNSGGIDGSFVLATRHSQRLKGKGHQPWRCAVASLARWTSRWEQQDLPSRCQACCKACCRGCPGDVPLRHCAPYRVTGRCFVRRALRIRGACVGNFVLSQ